MTRLSTSILHLCTNDLISDEITHTLALLYSCYIPVHQSRPSKARTSRYQLLMSEKKRCTVGTASAGCFVLTNLANLS